MRKIGFGVMASLVLASCSNNNLFPVSGKVTYKGSPASGAVLTLLRQGGAAGKQPPLIGIVQQDGSFELLCGSLGKGAPPGQYDVLVEWKRVLGAGKCCEGKDRFQSGPDKLNGRYADPKNPRLHVTIKAESNELPPFELTD